MVILIDQFNLPEDIYKIIFATEQQELAGKMLIKYMWENGGEIGKTEMGLFATKLHEGEPVKGSSNLKTSHNPVRNSVKFNPVVKKEENEDDENMSYNKRQFYDRILTPMKSMGLIDYDLYKKTYRISDKFNKLMIKIGLMWLRELDEGKRKAAVGKVSK